MAELLSMKEEPKTELTSDEQESLAIGEELEKQQDTLLAGKYKNAEELEKAYKELESKLGSQEPDETKAVKEEEEKPEAKEEKTELEKAFLESLWEESQEEGDFKQDTLDKLKDMNPTDLAQEYLNYRAANVQPELQQKDIDNLYNVAGGKEGYTDMMNWAKANVAKQEIEMYDAVMAKNDPLAAFFAVKALHYRYNDAQGVDGTLLTGKAARAETPGYKSQASLVQAMSDPRYDKDPAYRQEVIEKLSRSDIEF